MNKKSNIHTMNAYYCNQCNNVILLDSKKKWIPSCCYTMDRKARLILIKADYQCASTDRCPKMYRINGTKICLANHEYLKLIGRCPDRVKL